MLGKHTALARPCRFTVHSCADPVRRTRTELTFEELTFGFLQKRPGAAYLVHFNGRTPLHSLSNVDQKNSDKYKMGIRRFVFKGSNPALEFDTRYQNSDANTKSLHQFLLLPPLLGLAPPAIARGLIRHGNSDFITGARGHLFVLMAVFCGCV